MPSQLIHLRQRIKAIEAIKKITHAMRLISMSTHSRLRHKKEHLVAYKNSFLRLSHIIKQAVASSDISAAPADQTNTEHILILVSSQKGLCGTFNENIFNFFSQEHKTLEANQHVITVGTYATDFIKRVYKKNPFQQYNKFNSVEFVKTAQHIADLITSTSYAQVTVYSTSSVTFFTQKPQKKVIFPIPEQSVSTPSAETISALDYLWEQSPLELEASVKQLTVLILLQELLFDSLFSEQAARFLSMDGATRNAENLLTATKLEYNKIRQAAITRELIELSGSAGS